MSAIEMEQQAELIDNLYKLRCEHRDMLRAHLRWFDTTEIVNFKRQGTPPCSLDDIFACAELIKEGEAQLKKSIGN